MVRGVEHPIQKEKLREMGFSGLEKTKQEAGSNSSLPLVYLQGITEMIEPETEMKGQEEKVPSCSNRSADIFYNKHLNIHPEKLVNLHP